MIIFNVGSRWICRALRHLMFLEQKEAEEVVLEKYLAICRYSRG